jgi:hypothetical protein
VPRTARVTTAVGIEMAELEPTAFVAVTSATIREPTSNPVSV